MNILKRTVSIELKVWQTVALFLLLLIGCLSPVLLVIQEANKRIATLEYQQQAYQFSEKANAQILGMSFDLIDTTIDYSPYPEKGREILVGIKKVYIGSQDILYTTLYKK